MGEEMAGIVLRGQRVLPKRLVETGFAFEFATLAGALGDLARVGA
jgi:NAD dependent epimerase/dehydratase family enzyme